MFYLINLLVRFILKIYLKNFLYIKHAKRAHPNEHIQASVVTAFPGISLLRPWRRGGHQTGGVRLDSQRCLCVAGESRRSR